MYLLIGLEKLGKNCVTALVICGKLLFLLAYYLGALFGTDHYLDRSILKLLLTYQMLISSCGKKSGFVEEVSKIRTGKSDCGLCDLFKRNVIFKGLALCVYLQYLKSSLDVGIADRYLTVKASGTEKCGIEYIGTVGSRNDYYRSARAEAVHLNEELV